MRRSAAGGAGAEEPLPGFYAGTPGKRGRKGWFLRGVTTFLNFVERSLGRVPWVKDAYGRILAGLEAKDVLLPVREDLPALEGLRIALLSDLHAGPFLGKEEARRILEVTRAASPDLVCLCGDLIAMGNSDLDLLEPLLAGLDPPLGTFAVTGNHEFFHGDPALLQARLEERGIRVLRNRGIRVERGGGSLWVCGVDDPGEGEPDLEAALEGRRDGEPAILLCHHPDFFPRAAREGIVLQVSGHTHGGQFRFFRRALVAHTRLGYLQGLFRRGESLLYVSGGVGAILLPWRIGAPPELPVLVFPS